MNNESSPSKEDSAAHGNEQSGDNTRGQSEGAFDPKVEMLLEQGDKIIAQMDPIMREALSGKPEELAEWEALMQEYAQIAAEGQKPHSESASESEKEAEEARLSREISERMALISADLDRFMNREPPDLEIEGALERNFAAMHELDLIMRQRCRDYPAQLAEWLQVMEFMDELETMFALGREAENAEPAN